MVLTPPDPGPGSNASDSAALVEARKNYSELMGAAGGWNGEIDKDIHNSISAAIMMVARYNEGKITVPGPDGQPGTTYKVSDNGQLRRVKEDGSVNDTPEANDIYHSPDIAHALALKALTIKANMLAEQMGGSDIDKRLAEIRDNEKKVALEFGKSPEETQDILRKARNAANYEDAARLLKPIVGNSQRSDDLITYLMFLQRMERSAESGKDSNRDVTDDLRNNIGLRKFAAVTDIIGAQATGTKPDPAINSVDGKPPSQNLPDVDFRLFDARVYDIMGKAYINDQGQMAFPNVPGELVGPQYAGKFLTHKEISLIAQERLDQRMHDLGIPPHRLTETLFDKDSRLAVTPQDLRLVLFSMGEGNISPAHHTAFNQKYGSLGDVPQVTTYIRSGYYSNPDYNVEERSIDGAGILKRLQERPSLQGFSTEYLNRTFSAAEYFDLEDHGSGSHNFMGDLAAKNALNYDQTKRLAAGIVNGDPNRIASDAHNTPGAPEVTKPSPEQKTEDARECSANMCRVVPIERGPNGPSITLPEQSTTPLAGAGLTR